MTTEAGNMNHLSLARKGAPHETAAGNDGAGTSPKFAAPAAVSLGIVEQLFIEDAARELALEIEALPSKDAWTRWRNSRQAVVTLIWTLISDSPARNRLSRAIDAAKERSEQGTPQKAQSRGESRRFS